MWFSAGVVAMYNNYVNTATIFANIVGASAWDQIDLKWLVIIAMGMNASNVILLRNAFEGVPSEIEEAARIDGATELQVLTKVYIPMSKATIATVALFFGISRWNGYYWSYRMMTTQAYSWPVQVYIRDFISTNTTLAGKSDATEIPWDESFAAESVVYSMVICAIVPILIIYPFIQKYFAKGVNMGGVKE
jgi:putative aldouronate transport system permease protein